MDDKTKAGSHTKTGTRKRCLDFGTVDGSAVLPLLGLMPGGGNRSQGEQSGALAALPIKAYAPGEAGLRLSASEDMEKLGKESVERSGDDFRALRASWAAISGASKVSVWNQRRA